MEFRDLPSMCVPLLSVFYNRKVQVFSIHLYQLYFKYAFK